MAYMHTKRGLLESPYDVQPEDFDIRFIAAGLSRLGRYVGRGSRFLSVAEHSVAVSGLVPPPLAKVGLLHDATEAFVGDVHSEIKKLMVDNGDETFKYLEQHFWELIATKYGLPLDMPEEVHRADLAVRETEMHELFHGGVVFHVPPRAAERMFLNRARVLGLPC